MIVQSFPREACLISRAQIIKVSFPQIQGAYPSIVNRSQTPPGKLNAEKRLTLSGIPLTLITIFLCASNVS